MAELEKKISVAVQEEQEWVRQEQATHTAHLEQVLAHFGQEVQKVEELQKNTIAVAAAAATASAICNSTPISYFSIRILCIYQNQ